MHGEKQGADWLTNFTLIEKLSQTYKETGKYDIRAIRDEMTRKKASKNAIGLKHKLQGIAAQRM